MSLRKIIVVSTTRTTPKELYSAATTWRQLQDSLSEFGNVSSMRAVVKETKNDLSSPDAVLPEGDFTLFLAPKQIKAGGFGVDVASVLRALQERWNDAIEEVIEEVENGDHAGSVQGATRGTSSVSSEDRDLLARIARGEF